MVKKRLEEFKEEELASLTEEQLKELEEKGEIDLPDGQPNQEGSSSSSAPPTEEAKEEQEQPMDTLSPEDVKRLQKEVEEYKRRLEELEREKQGILADLIKTRHKVKEETAEQPKTQLPWETIQDDDFITGAQLKQIISYIQQQEEIRKRQEFIDQQIKRVEESRKKAESKYPDYADMIKVFNEICQQNPKLADAVFYDPDPAERAYQIAKAYQLVQQQSQISEIEEKLSKPKPKVMTGKGSSSSRITPERILQMSDEELEKLTEEEWNEILRD